MPPSVNGMYRNARAGSGFGRFKTGRYRSWLKDADKHLLLQFAGRLSLHIKPMTGPLSVRITVPRKTRGDVSNYIKAAEDYLVSREITGDDKNNVRVSCEKGDVDCCVVEILPYPLGGIKRPTQ